MKSVLLGSLIAFFSLNLWAEMDGYLPSTEDFGYDMMLLGDSPILQVYDFPDNVPIHDSGCIFTDDSISLLSGKPHQKVYFGGCRNQEYCASEGLEGSGKWICSPSGAGQTSKCFQCK